MKASVVVLNYNYGRFVADAIESCLSQEHRPVEVIVVDDGSTDDSRDVIDRYADRIDRKVYQTNQGPVQASNAGFARSTGDVVLFLDADDYLFPDTIARVVDAWREGISKVHYRVRTVDPAGRELGCIPPERVRLSRGDVWSEILTTGSCEAPPMSGNAYARRVLDEIFPITDARVSDTGAYFDVVPTDAYLRLRVPAYGPVEAISEPLAAKRIHGRNLKGRSPYVNPPKRQRLLRLTRLNAGFIRERLREGDGMDAPPEAAEAWTEDVLFRRDKLVRLRMLSLRFDGDDHPWPDDTRPGILRLYLRTAARGPRSLPKLVHGLVILALLAVLPRKAAHATLRLNALLGGRSSL